MKYPVLFTVTDDTGMVSAVVFCEDEKSFSLNRITPGGFEVLTDNDMNENPFTDKTFAANVLGVTPNIANAMSPKSPKTTLAIKEGATMDEYDNVLSKLKSNAEKYLTSRMDALVKYSEKK